ncbi:MAG: pyrroline-5-carboxylate reductase, partial [Thioalkalispiraceae bacterium]
MTSPGLAVNLQDMENINIGFIGAGNMASALIGGLCKSGFPGERLYVSDLDPDKLQPLVKTFNLHSSPNNQALIEQCQVIVLAVKPQVMKDVISELQTGNDDRLYLSIAAGIRTDHLRDWFARDVALVRAMPNTPALVQTGASGLFANQFVSGEQKAIAQNILAAVGLALWVKEESQLDAVTALSGSGPAYFFYMMEAMEAAGKQLGLDSETVHALTVQTALGAAKLAQTATEDPAQLRRRVTSPGGTTEAAINYMQSENSLNIIKQAVLEAERR